MVERPQHGTSNEWIERNGGPEAITPRFVAFLETRLSGQSLDLEGDKETRPDYSCLGGAVIIEIKSLETNPSERLKNALEPAMESENWPRFYGKWPMESILKNLPIAEAASLKRKLTSRLGRAIVNHLKKARKQLENYERQNSGVYLRLLVLINEDHVEYDPTIVVDIIQSELTRLSENGTETYEKIDAVVFLTERHATNLGGDVTFPIVVIHGPKIENSRMALKLLNVVVSRWAIWSSGKNPRLVSHEDMRFKPIHENPPRMRRQDLWEQEYRRRPFMHSWSNEDVVGLWDVTTLLSLLSFHIDPPMRVPKEGMTPIMQRITNLMMEFASRGIPLDRIKPTKERMEVAISKLTYPPVVLEWLRKQVEHVD